MVFLVEIWIKSISLVSFHVTREIICFNYVEDMGYI